ncbi:MAG TPA: hypothetical protein VGH61_12455 [Steroidobacteraceae bacterium]
MQFVLFDVTATLVFLGGYLAVVALQRRRTPAVATATSTASRILSRDPRPTTPPRREWPRLSYPR